LKGKKEKIQEYISNLKTPEGVPILETKKYTGFLGFHAGLEACYQMGIELLTNIERPLKYILMHKMSQVIIIGVDQRKLILNPQSVNIYSLYIGYELNCVSSLDLSRFILNLKLNFFGTSNHRFYHKGLKSVDFGPL
jgi:hypothetical protein